MSFATFINHAASQIREVREVHVCPESAHFVVDLTTHNTQVVPRLDRLSSAVRSRWPGKGFSWSPWGDIPFEITRFEPPMGGRVYTVSGLQVDYRQKRSLL